MAVQLRRTNLPAFTFLYRIVRTNGLTYASNRAETYIFFSKGATMKKLLLLICAIGLFAFAGSAQKAADHSGSWKLDKAQSKLDQRMSAGIDTMTWTVSQTGNELKIVSEMKRVEATTPAAAGAPAGGPPAGAGSRGMGRGGDGTTVYSLDGKETTGEVDGPM